MAPTGNRRAAHAKGHTCIRYGADDGKVYIVTAGNDGQIRTWPYDKVLGNDEECDIVDEHTDGILDIAVGMAKTITGSLDHYCKMFDFPDGLMDGIIGRSDMPFRCVALDASSSTAAAGCDDHKIIVVSTIDTSQSKTLRGHEGPVKCVTFHPHDGMLASASCDGTIRVWSIKTASEITSLSILEKSNDPAKGPLGRIDFHPKGQWLAAPVGELVEVYDTESWEKMFVFQEDGGHSKPVSIVQWAPNGTYLASVSVDGVILVWETTSRESLNVYRHDVKGASISSIAWHLQGNEIAWADTDGNIGLWQNVIPVSSKFTQPGVSAAGVNLTEQKEKKQSLEAELFNHSNTKTPKKTPVSSRDGNAGGNKKRMLLDDEAAVSDADEDDEADDVGEQGMGQGRGHGDGDERGLYSHDEGDGSDIEDQDQDGMDLDGFISYDDRGGRGKQKGARRGGGKSASERAVMPLATLQPPFNPGSTPRDQTRRYLAWNDIGCILSRNEDTYCSVDIEFHDTMTSKNVHITDHYHFTMAALGAHGAVFASPHTKSIPSTLAFRYFNSWALNSDWTIQCDGGESIETVAVGTKWAAAATSLGYVRIVAMGGVQHEVYCLPGPVVTMAGHRDMLFIAYHGAQASASQQALHYMLYDVERRMRMVHGEPLPISTDATLQWCGFSDIGVLSTVDSRGILRQTLHGRDYMWCPFADLSTLKTNETDYHWTIGVTDTEVMTVICKGGKTFPTSNPRPIAQTNLLKVPFLGAGSAYSRDDEKILRSALNSENKQLLSEDAIGKDEQTRLDAIADTDLLRAISAACKAERAMRALDHCFGLRLEKSLDVAIKIATVNQQSNLAERINIILQAKKYENQNKRDQHQSRAAANKINRTVIHMNTSVAAPLRPMQLSAPRITTKVKQESKHARASKSSTSSKFVPKSATAPKRNANKRAPTPSDDEADEGVKDTEETPVEMKKRKMGSTRPGSPASSLAGSASSLSSKKKENPFKKSASAQNRNSQQTTSAAAADSEAASTQESNVKGKKKARNGGGFGQPKKHKQSTLSFGSIKKGGGDDDGFDAPRKKAPASTSRSASPTQTRGAGAGAGDDAMEVDEDAAATADAAQAEATTGDADQGKEHSGTPTTTTTTTTRGAEGGKKDRLSKFKFTPAEVETAPSDGGDGRHSVVAEGA